MAQLGAPPKKDYPELPSDVFEVLIKDCEEVPNTRYYDPAKDDKRKATQFKWTMMIREEGDYTGSLVTYFTCSYIGRHSKNKLTNLCTVADPDFNIDVAYSSEEDFRARMLYKPLRVTLQSTEYEKDGETKTFAKVVGVLPTKMGPATDLEILTLQSTEVNPF